jgi:large subunit ribosomal protein L21
MYAVVETGGKQYRVQVGQTVQVERIEANIGDTVELGRVLMVSGDQGIQVGSPVVEGAKVAATVVEQGRAPKVIVFKYRPKQRYRLKKGHRQHFTGLRIDEIVAG